ncbi:hypothetical protein D918_08598 [Trichuris suis]|nr:hypothetical protein D918_08598 [Trichuris suis]
MLFIECLYFSKTRTPERLISEGIIFQADSSSERKLWQQGIEHVLTCLDIWHMKHEMTKL